MIEMKADIFTFYLKVPKNYKRSTSVECFVTYMEYVLLFLPQKTESEFATPLCWFHSDVSASLFAVVDFLLTLQVGHISIDCHIGCIHFSLANQRQHPTNFRLKPESVVHDLVAQMTCIQCRVQITLFEQIMQNNVNGDIPI